MSSFIVNNTTIHRIISGIKQAKLTEELEDFFNSDETAFGQALINMNISAVDQRYTDKNDPIKYTFVNVGVTKIQAFKSLNCLLYQCLEGCVPERTLYKTMRQVGDQLAASIVNDLPSYDTAEWA